MLSSSPISKLALSIILSLGSLCSCIAITPAESDFFEKHIRPIFATRCSECHSHSAGKTKGGLSLDHRAGWKTGGDSGPALIPGELDLSILIKAVRYRDTDLQMPPKAKLADQEIRNSLGRLRARCRELERNSDYVRRFLSGLESKNESVILLPSK